MIAPSSVPMVWVPVLPYTLVAPGQSPALVSLDHYEEAYSNRATIVLAAGSSLDPNVSLLSPEQYLGVPILISYGYFGTDGAFAGSVDHGPLYVVRWDVSSEEGVVLLTFDCVSWWEFLEGSAMWRDPRANLEPPPLVWPRTTTILDIVKARIEPRAPVFLDEDDGIIATYAPYIEAQQGDSVLAFVRNMMNMTECAISIRPDGFHIVRPDIDKPPHYTYSTGGHTFYRVNRSNRLIIPNTVYAVEQTAAIGSKVKHVGTAEDVDSLGKVGTIATFIVDSGIKSAAEASNRAGAWMRRQRLKKWTGNLRVPMNPVQEIYDVVEANDWRSGIAMKGVVTRLHRHWSQGEYFLDMSLGMWPVVGLIAETGYHAPPIDSSSHVTSLPSPQTPGAIPGRRRKVLWVIPDAATVGVYWVYVDVTGADWYPRGVRARANTSPGTNPIDIDIQYKPRIGGDWTTLFASGGNRLKIQPGDNDDDETWELESGFVAAAPGQLRVEILGVGASGDEGADLKVELDFETKIAGQ